MVKSVQEEVIETRTRARTRRTILQAAVDVFATDKKASMSEVAQHAGVARSTLKRYFPERGDLVDALGHYVEELVTEATERARIAEGFAIEALERLAVELFELRKAAILSFTDETFETEVATAADAVTKSGGDPDEEVREDADIAFYELIERGHEDGTIDPRITPIWAQNLLWSTLYAGWAYSTVTRVSNFEALGVAIYSLRKAVEHR